MKNGQDWIRQLIAKKHMKNSKFSSDQVNDN